MIFQFLINSLIIGSIYALVASGFSLIYSVVKFPNFAHGALITLGVYLLYLFFSILGLNFWFSIILTIVLVSLIGLFLNFAVYRKFREKKANSTILFVVSFNLLILFESLVLLLFGADFKTLGYFKVNKGLEFFGAIITPLQIFIIIISFLLFLSLFYFMYRTKMGKAMRAVASNKEVAETVGISSEKIYNFSFIIGSALAGLAAIFICLEQNIRPMIGTNLMIKGFTASIVGGIGNVPRAVISSFLIGLIENLGIMFLPSSYKDGITFMILFLFLILRYRKFNNN
nr:branched-chain amino acid ABC transporter permease [Nanoarchaeum sp.]